MKRQAHTPISKDIHACHVCDAAALTIVPEYDELLQVTSDCKPWKGDIHLAVCLSCGTVQKLTDRSWQSEVDEIYAGYTIYYQAAGAEQAVFDKDSGQAFFRSDKLLSAVRSNATLPHSGRILDIGCGNGGLLRSFARLEPDWLLAGTEIDGKYRKEVESIRENTTLYTCPFEDISETFDLVTMLHVLEHIVNPLRFIDSIKRNIKDDGFLVIDVPDYRQNPFDLLIADHSTHFSVYTLGNLLERAGFSTLVSTTEWIAKEISFIAKKNGNKEGLRDKINGKTGNLIYEEVAKSIRWISRFRDLAKEASRKGSFGIFGTSIIGTWLFGEIDENVSFFVDEDPNRVGRTHLGRPIFHPREVPKGSNVFIALPLNVAGSVLHRLACQDVSFFMPPPFTD